MVSVTCSVIKCCMITAAVKKKKNDSFFDDDPFLRSKVTSTSKASDVSTESSNQSAQRAPHGDSGDGCQGGCRGGCQAGNWLWPSPSIPPVLQTRLECTILAIALNFDRDGAFFVVIQNLP